MYIDENELDDDKESGEITGGSQSEIQYSLSEDVFFQLDKENNIID